MYREVPSSLWKGKSKKDPQGPDWELIATSAESLTEVGERLKRSKKRADQDLADLVSFDPVSPAPAIRPGMVHRCSSGDFFYSYMLYKCFKGLTMPMTNERSALMHI